VTWQDIGREFISLEGYTTHFLFSLPGQRSHFTKPGTKECPVALASTLFLSSLILSRRQPEVFLTLFLLFVGVTVLEERGERGVRFSYFCLIRNLTGESN
jgi:hypothetical protein